jgi:hypothetical protein
VPAQRMARNTHIAPKKTTCLLNRHSTDASQVALGYVHSRTSTPPLNNLQQNMHALHASHTHSPWSEGPHRLSWPYAHISHKHTFNSTQQKHCSPPAKLSQRLKKVCMDKAFSLCNQTESKTRQHAYVPRRKTPFASPRNTGTTAQRNCCMCQRVWPHARATDNSSQ